MPSTPVDPSPRRTERGNVTQQVFDDLRQRILGRQFALGDKLPTERQLLETYNVSVTTVREAIRGLASAGLVEIKHGKGVYVTARAEELVANSLFSMIQLEKVGMVQVLGVHGALNTYASELAAARATTQEVDAMQQALAAIDHAVTPEDIAAGLTRFLNALVRASGNPLLIALCQFLASVQIGLAREIQGKRFEAWRKTAARLSKERQRIVDAIRIGDVEGARVAARAFHERSIKVITTLPNADGPIVSDLAVDQQATTHRIGDGQRAAIAARQSSDYRESQPAVRIAAASGVKTHERLQGVVKLIVRNARAMVTQRHRPFSMLHASRDFDGWFTIRHRVFQQISENTIEVDQWQSELAACKQIAASMPSRLASSTRAVKA
ncbi:hypothetical protein KCU90_g788, partial [Aureobasidium melanogenum]